MAKVGSNRAIPALKVNQWLAGWNQISFQPKYHRKKPLPYFYIFSLPARELRTLSGISRRQSANLTPRAADLGIQRQLDEERTEEIRKFVEFGYPWSTLSEKKRTTSEFNDLRKPGWLPTAIVVNILNKGDERDGIAIADADLITINDNDGVATLSLPYDAWKESWHAKALPPIEVIDGQHRLWAFDFQTGTAGFDLPVVAFNGLDISWQAYLFWTINIKPKRINPSLAFDLYPLLRGEDWLERAEGHAIYRETRSQELTEALWSNDESPWYDRINMLGEKGIRGVTQSAWIKALMATMVRPWEGKGKKTGGLFGSRIAADGEVLRWSRAQQAAFLIFAWQRLREAVAAAELPWATDLRKRAGRGSTDDAAFYGPFTLIATDQGVRGYLWVLNDMCFSAAARLKLNDWKFEKTAAASDAQAVSAAITSLRKQPVAAFVDSIASGVAKFDWRTSATPDLSAEQRREKLAFRGSSGYKEMRLLLLQCLHESGGEVGRVARQLG